MTNEELLALAKKARAMLFSLQFCKTETYDLSEVTSETISSCPCCNEEYGHRINCELNRLLKELPE